MSTIPFWLEYDRSLCNNRVGIFSVTKVSKFRTKKDNKDMYKLFGMDEFNNMRELLFYSPSHEATEVLQNLKQGDVVLIQARRWNNDGSLWCNDIVMAKKVA